MTTLVDFIMAMTTLSERRIEGNGESIREAMGDCAKYVVRKDVEDIAIEIMCEVGRAEMPWPLPLQENVWLESSARLDGELSQMGVLLRTGGIGIVVMRLDAQWTVVPITHDFEQQEVTMIIDPRTEHMRQEFGVMLDRFLLILHMIQQPRIVERRPVVHHEKLQRARAKSGKMPLVEYHEVVVHVTRRERLEAAAAGALERATGRRLHRVRPHYRVCRGVIQRIAAYWRGSAELGVVLASGHRVAR